MLAAGLHAHVAHPTMAKSMRLRSLRPKVRREAYVLAYADGFYLVGISMLLSLGVVAILRKPPKADGRVEAH